MNSCHICHSTCYRPVIIRDESGRMLPSGRYQCVKCKFEFSSVAAWRGDQEEQPAVSAPPTTSTDSTHKPAAPFTA